MSVEALAECIRHSISGDPWHGPAFADLLADISEAEAAAHPIAGAHSILEIVRHVTSWIEETDSRLRGNPPALPVAGDWPAVSAWLEAQARLKEAHERLQRSLAAFPAARLSEVIGDLREPPLGTGVTYEATLLGLAQHHAYHGGQIALLRRALSDAA